MRSADVSVRIDDALDYCRVPPFHPAVAYPEFRGAPTATEPTNRVYEAVRACLANLGLDAERFGGPDWNPLGEWVRPGDRVLVKPNLVLHFHGASDDIDAVVTHGSVVRPIVDYALLALRGEGSVTIADAPHGNADFDRIVRANGLRDLVAFYQAAGRPVTLVDLRKHVYGHGPQGFVQSVRCDAPGDPAGYRLVDVGPRSFLEGLDRLDLLYGADFDRSFIAAQHRGGHRYLLSGTALDADVVLSVPKMKTHKKVGVTVNLKNLVGICGDKNYLPHYRIGPPSRGGDEHPDTRSPVLRALRRWRRFASDRLLAPNTRLGRVAFAWLDRPLGLLDRIETRGGARRYVRWGDWPGNDTAWRMCLDLNLVLRYADAGGRMRAEPQRRYFSIVDGIVAGSGDGPMMPTARRIGYLAAGPDPVVVDRTCAAHMGFDPDRIPLLREAARSPEFAARGGGPTVRATVNGSDVESGAVHLGFDPHWAWRGRIERPGHRSAE